MNSSTTQTQEVLNHHLTALGENNLEELLKDYTEESEIWGPEGALRGIAAIGAFFTEALKLFPTGKTSFELKQMIVKDDRAYITWVADSPVASFSVGTDSFIIKNSRIELQTWAANVTPK